MVLQRVILSWSFMTLAIRDEQMTIIEIKSHFLLLLVQKNYTQVLQVLFKISGCTNVIQCYSLDIH